MKNKLFTFLFLLIISEITLTKRSIQKCLVDKNLKCTLNESKYLGINEYCMDKNGNIYRGIDNMGLCIMVGYSEQEQTDIDIRGDGSAVGSENPGFYIKDNSGNNLSVEATGKLNYCSFKQGTTEIECNEVFETMVQSGYYRNADEGNENIPYIKCTKGSNICESIKISNGCTEVGAIIKEKNVFKLCLDNDIAVSLSETDKKYFLSINSPSVFGQSNGKYVMIRISNENALKDEIENKKYQYSNDAFEVKTKNENAEICDDEYKMNEFELIDDKNYYYQNIN